MPDMWINSGETQWQSGGIEFMIVSDYGNLQEETVSVNIDIVMNVGVWEYEYSPYFDSFGDSYLYIDSPGIGMNEVWADKNSMDDWFASYDAYELLTNTRYTIFADLNVAAEIFEMSIPPENFLNELEYNEFFSQNPVYSSAAIEAFADLGYCLELNSAENPVPVPPAVWLLGSDLVGLVAVRRKA
jgi:hypothetical protein